LKFELSWTAVTRFIQVNPAFTCILALSSHAMTLQQYINT